MIVRSLLTLGSIQLRAFVDMIIHPVLPYPIKITNVKDTASGSWIIFKFNVKFYYISSPLERE